ncbi:hypothetical protein [Dyella choica]|uniref:Uncharacterized protein n=1 Tax=Dyella choica TaxID=1927959 RepID=A0A3S0PPX3_9GAMM|nr:hypothetical protein [Dyella choica]RUL79020.1 hypothetical protein EKH80_04265 [Dyella choica]
MNARIDASTGIATPATDPAKPSVGPSPALIARHRGDDPFAYEALRDRALTFLQALSGEQWTDFNYHDPGVTLLDALCYALTENLFGAQQPLVDLLAAPDGRIHYRRLGLRAAEEILPCRPCTSMDYMRWLLDRVPGALQVHASLPDSNGLWRMDLEALTTHAETATAAAARAYWAQRSLGEDLAALPSVLKPRWCTLQLNLSIEGARTPEEILAELVARCAEHIDAAPRRLSLMARLVAQDGAVSLADALDGPRMRQGWIDTDSLERDLESRVYFGDLARIALGVDGVLEVSDISLDAHGLDGSGGALPRHGDDWVLRLRWPDQPEAVAAWQIKRRGVPIGIAQDALLQRLDDLRRNADGRAAADSAPTATGSPLARPQGEYLPPEAYVSLQHQLPPIYRERVDLTGAPIHAAEAAQFHAYLALLEQWLAHGDAQTHHLRKLYTMVGKPMASYAWQVLGDEHIAGLDVLYTMDREQIRENVFASADDVLERRGRVLDHLLALYGEGCWQGSIRPFGWYFGAEAWRRHLFEQKRLMLLRIATLTRDRHGAIDYSRRSLGRRGNTSALQQRASLLLAFKYHHSRLLLPAMSEAQIGLTAEADAAAATDALPAKTQPPVLFSPRRQRVLDSMGKDLAGAARVLALHFPELDLRALPPALLRSAVHAERYKHMDAGAVWLASDDKGPCWRLQLRSARLSPEAAAICLHEFACRLQLECEGFHLVEHVLLRPLSGSDPDIPDDFYRYRVTAVFPAWTARGNSASFRRVAMETLALNAPAHLRLQTLWLDAAALLRFERSYAAWLDAKQAHCAAMLSSSGERDAAERRLEDWTRLLRWLLWRHLEAVRPDDARGAA